MNEQLRYVGVYLDYEKVYGRKPTWEMVKELLRPYSPRHLLNALAYISTQLGRGEGGRDIEMQAHLIRSFFPKNYAKVLATAQRFQREKGFAFVAVFAEVHLRNFVKAILIHCESTTSIPPPSLQPLGDVFLMLNDLTDYPRDVPNDQEAFIGNLLAMLTQFRSEPMAQSLARSFDLFLTDRTHLRDSPNYIDLPQEAASVLGCDPVIYWALQFANYGRILAFEDLIPDGENLSLHFDSFAAGYELSVQETAAFRRMTLGDFDVMKEAATARYGQEFKQFDALVLAKTPIIAFSNCAFCPSRILLEEKLRHGLYHVHLDPALPEAQRARFQRFFGDVFADYARTLLKRLYGDRFIDLDATPLAADGAKVCDAAIRLDRNLVLIEFKSGVIPAAVRSATDSGLLTRSINDTYVNAIRQLDSTAQKIEQGGLATLGIRPDDISNYLPLIITYDSTPMLDPLYGYIMSQVNKGHSYPSLTKERPIQMMSCDELECLSGLHSKDLQLHHMFLHKAYSDHAGGSFKNHWDTLGYELVIDPELQALFDRHSQRAIDAMTARRTPAAR